MKKFIHAVQFMQSLTNEYRGQIEVLVYIQARQDVETLTNVSDVVYARVFGTGPTVHTKIKGLLAKGYIVETPYIHDGRVKNMYVTPVGEKLLKLLDKQLVDAMKS